MFFGKNLRYLRETNGKPSQEKLGKQLGLTRSAISSYEDGRAEPKFDTLNTIANHFNVTVDQLLNVDLSKLSDEVLKQKKNLDKYIQGENLRVLAITTDNKQNENIEFVPVKASAGYTTGYADSEYISELPKYHLPFLPKGKTYRAFEVKGDSMLPLKPRSIVIGEYVEDFTSIKDGMVGIVVARNLSEGIVLKKIYNRVPQHGVFVLKSSNLAYPSYEIAAEHVIEIWKFAAYISKEFPEETNSLGDLKEAFWRLEDELRDMKDHQQNSLF
ncbi:XRE family transcriptional regulator [Chondrinema litorale]|uniref:XRE family transcriptional regulator n=1 Tax=Chondrinema litorale TaxID=2994555 RepID=UPI0025433B70|nr:LexA family transcriptional regulator [Chondrinema litorale]UZR93350.1 LexA family transcriptional regulator [Chondrinema litorale]